MSERQWSFWVLLGLALLVLAMVIPVGLELRDVAGKPLRGGEAPPPVVWVGEGAVRAAHSVQTSGGVARLSSELHERGRGVEWLAPTISSRSTGSIADQSWRTSASGSMELSSPKTSLKRSL